MGSCIKMSPSRLDTDQLDRQKKIIQLQNKALKSNPQLSVNFYQKKEAHVNNIPIKSTYRELLQKMNKKTIQQKELFQECKGLPNLGNTCFLNSIVQFLFSAEQFRHIIMSQSQKTFDLKQILSNIFKAILQTKQKQLQVKEIYMKDLIKYLQNQRIDYKTSSQQDCLQFLLFILNKLQEHDEQYMKLFQIEYEQMCTKKDCNERSSLRQYYLTNNYDRCPSCNSRCEIKLIDKPQYIVILNIKEASKRQQFEFTNKKNYLLKYELKSQIFYTGTNRNGHYISNRKKLNPSRRQKDKFFYFNDEKIENQLQKFLGFVTVASLYQIKPKNQQQKNQSYQSPREQFAKLKIYSNNPVSYQLQNNNQKEIQVIKQQKDRKAFQLAQQVQMQVLKQQKDREVYQRGQQANKNINIPQRDKEYQEKNKNQTQSIKPQQKNSQTLKVKSPQKHTRPKIQSQNVDINNKKIQINTKSAQQARQKSQNIRNQKKNQQQQYNKNLGHQQKKEIIVYKIQQFFKNSFKNNKRQYFQIYFIQQEGNKIEVNIDNLSKQHKIEVLQWDSTLDRSVKEYVQKKASNKFYQQSRSNSRKKQTINPIHSNDKDSQKLNQNVSRQPHPKKGGF